MCGLIGYSGTSNYDPNIIKCLMLFNSIDRGKDATGFYNTEQGLVKKASEAKLFLPKTQIIPDSVFIGHVRAKTVGTNTDNNAHPFTFNNLVLAHNGTLQNHYELISRYKLKQVDYDVDSQMLGAVLNESMSAMDYSNEIIDPLNYFKPLSEYLGAAALLFKDKRDIKNKRHSRLFAYRNEDRPLCIGYDQNGNMYLSSISEPLVSCGLVDIEELETDTVYEIEDGEIIAKHPITRYVKNQGVTTDKQSIFNFLTGGVFNTDFYDLPLSFVQFNLTEETCKKYNIKGFTPKKLYFVKDIDINSFDKDEIFVPTSILVYNDQKKVVSMPIFAFNLLYSSYAYSEYGKTLTDIDLSDDKSTAKKICTTGTIVKTIGVSRKGNFSSQKDTYDVIDIKILSENKGVDNQNYVFRTSWVQPLTLEEVSEYLKAQENLKKKNIDLNKSKKNKSVKIPNEILAINEMLTFSLEDLAKEQLEVDQTLNNANLEPLDLVTCLDNVKTKLDELSIFLLKNVSKKKNNLDHNIISFGDVYPYLIKIYDSLSLNSDLKNYKEELENNEKLLTN